jgi:hypothetical protein
MDYISAQWRCILYCDRHCDLYYSKLLLSSEALDQGTPFKCASRSRASWSTYLIPERKQLLQQEGHCTSCSTDSHWYLESSEHASTASKTLRQNLSDSWQKFLRQASVANKPLRQRILNVAICSWNLRSNLFDIAGCQCQYLTPYIITCQCVK